MSDESTKNQVTIGGRQFVASCITLGIMRRQASALKTVMHMKIAKGPEEKELPSPQEFQAVIDIVGAAVKPVEPLPKSPDKDISDFEAFVDGLDFKEGVKDLLVAMGKVMALSGYQDKKEEIAGLGEPESAASST